MNSLAWIATYFDLESIGYAAFVNPETTLEREGHERIE
jgi:hypothetical protein